MFYQSAESRDTALAALSAVLQEGTLQIADPTVRLITEYEPQSFGLDVPEPLMLECYVMRPDISPVIGWETGRASEPAFMDMNLHSTRGDSSPTVVVYQYDLADPMNPNGLLVAYAEEQVKPVVSDFDTFTVGSRGMRYEQTPKDQLSLVSWALEHTNSLLGDLNSQGWMQRWLEVLKVEARNGFHPKFPKYGFGDPTSYGLIGDVVDVTKSYGAVRHGAECFNFFFPQVARAPPLHVPWRATRSRPVARPRRLSHAAEDVRASCCVWPEACVLSGSPRHLPGPARAPLRRHNSPLARGPTSVPCRRVPTMAGA